MQQQCTKAHLIIEGVRQLYLLTSHLLLWRIGNYKIPIPHFLIFDLHFLMTPSYLMSSLSSIPQIMQQASTAFDTYRSVSPLRRADFLEAIAARLEAAGDDLLALTSSETNLPVPRLRGEMARTWFQLRLYASLLREGHWVNAIIDHAKPGKTPPAPDLRSMHIPIGPVVVFGASNFPYAFSTAGGDSASALAAGCPVVVKQHPGHAETSSRVFDLMREVAEQLGMPAHVVQHVADEGFATGKALVQHPATAAVGFTGSHAGGMALQGYAQERKHPIPVFAEMGSVNPVLLLPGALDDDAKGLAEKYAGSITLGMGQFCTNPGLLLGVESLALDYFAQHLADEVQKFEEGPMLHKGIEKAYLQKLKSALEQKGISILTGESGNEKPVACIARVDAETFLANPLLHEEIFGPYSLLVVCKNAEELHACRKALGGQITTTIMGTNEDLAAHPQLVETALQLAGRVVFNGVPTGVEVTGAMVHGGPQPACTDSRFTAVGPMAIYRWTRPVSWQNAPQQVLPPELQDDNPLGIWRRVNGKWMQ